MSKAIGASRPVKRKRKRRHPLGVILYEGPSLYDGAPIAVVANKIWDPSQNDKTGPLIGIAAFRTDVDPVTAHKMGLDYSVCFTCPLRKGACYVVIVNGILQTWKSYKAGKYVHAGEADVLAMLASSRFGTRFGTYGNISAGPFEVVEQVIEAKLDSAEPRWTMYVADWETCDQRFRHVSMASVQSVDQAIRAHNMGWRFYLSTFEEEREEAFAALKAAGIKLAGCPYRQFDADDPSTWDAPQR